MNFILPLAVTGLLAVFAKRSVSRLTNIRVQFKDLTNVKVSLLRTTMDLRLNIINPENTNVQINSVFADVLINDRKAGLVNASFSQRIAARQTVTVKLPITVSNSSTIQTIIQAVIRGEVKGVKIGFVGFVDTSVGRVSFTESQEFNL